MCFAPLLSLFFFFNDTATTEIYTLSLHDALPILSPWKISWRSCVSCSARGRGLNPSSCRALGGCVAYGAVPDRKSTRLNSSHGYISYAVFCLKKKKKTSKHAKVTSDVQTHHRFES